MKAVIYARYSSDNQREESIEGQIRECTAFAEKNDITVLRHYIDRAYSAKTDNRPEFQQMIRDSAKHLFDMVIVWKLDRFSRNRYDSARYKVQLKKNGVKLVSATEHISEGAEGIILESMLEGIAEYYSADLSEKVVRGMTENLLKGKFNGGSIPIGYTIDKDKHFQVDPVVAPLIVEAFERYAAGATMKEVRIWLNSKGVKNPKGNEMSHNSVLYMLHNRRYIGEYEFRGEINMDVIPPIMSRELFDRVQKRIEETAKAPARHKAKEEEDLLTTKLFCGYCGAYLCGECGTSRTGDIYHYYKCVSVKKRRQECHKKPVRKRWIEDIVVQATMEKILDDDWVESVVSFLMAIQEEENTALPLYEKQLRETEQAIDNMLHAIEQGVLTRSTKERLENLEQTRDDLELKIANEKIERPKISEDFIRFWIQRFRKLDMEKLEHRKMLIDAFVNAIFLYDDKVVLTFNYKEGQKTITFDDVNQKMTPGKSGSDMKMSGEHQGRSIMSGLFVASDHSLKTEIWYLNRRPFPLGACIKLEGDDEWRHAVQ